MATVTSLSLGNRQMQAAVGSFNGRVLRVGKLCEATLPEGCLINGVITNEADFSAAVGAFWKQNDLPRKNVSVTLNSSQFLSRMVTVPLLPPKKLQEIARWATCWAEASTGPGPPRRRYVLQHSGGAFFDDNLQKQ